MSTILFTAGEKVYMGEAEVPKNTIFVLTLITSNSVILTIFSPS